MLKDKTFAESQVQGWIDTICSKISHTLIDTNKPFKYIGTCATVKFTFLRSMLTYCIGIITVTAVIVQKNGTGLHIGHSTHWDISNDNAVVVRWPTEKKKDPNARLNCVVTVFGVAY